METGLGNTVFALIASGESVLFGGLMAFTQ